MEKEIGILITLWSGGHISYEWVIFLKISIITVSFNAADTIEQTIISVMEQTYKEIEYIVIDGGSNDGTVDILKKYDDFISYWCSEPDNGIYDAMNKGVKISSGDYIQIIGSDDCLLDKNTIQKVVESINEDTDIFSASRYEVSEKYKCQVLKGNESARKIKNGELPWMPHTGVFVSSQYMKKHLFDTSYKIVADYKFLLTAYMDEKIKFQYVDFPVAYFSLGGVSNNGGDQLRKERERLFDELNLRETFSVKSVDYDIKKWKIILKNFLDKTNMLAVVLCFFNIWQKHKCNNQVCRWCGR